MRLLESLAVGLLGLATGAVAQDDNFAVELDRAKFGKFIEQNSVVLTDCEYSKEHAPPDNEDLLANTLRQFTQYVSTP